MQTEPVTVLIADDSPTTRFAMRRRLEEWGYQVVDVDNGEDAWRELTSDDPPRIAILDWMMPGKDGVEICRLLQEHKGSGFIYTMLLTAKNEKQDIVYALDNGAHDFLSKPVFPEEMRSRVAVGRRLVEMTLLKNKFLGIAAHDLRNPLISIRGFAELMLEETVGPVTDGQKEFLEMTVTTSNTMLAMINDLLSVAAIESGKLELRLGHADLGALVKERVRLMEAAAGRKSITMHVSLEDTPDVCCDPERISQVVDNLLSNALKFSPTETKVRIDVTSVDGEVAVSVADQGPGVSPEDQDRLFGEFQRLSARPTGGESSTGLGLAIVKKIVEAHRGRVWLESKAGAGATFSFCLPVEQVCG